MFKVRNLVVAGLLFVSNSAFAQKVDVTCQSEDDGILERTLELQEITDEYENVIGYEHPSSTIGKMPLSQAAVSFDAEAFQSGDLLRISELEIKVLGDSDAVSAAEARGFHVAKRGSQIRLGVAGSAIADPEGLRCLIRFNIAE